MTTGKRWETLSAQQYFSGELPVSLFQPPGRGINSCLRLSQTRHWVLAISHVARCLFFFPSSPFASLPCAQCTHFKTFLSFCEDLSCLEAGDAVSIEAFSVTNSILFWFGLSHWTEVNLRSWSVSWTSRKINIVSWKENPGSPLQKFNAHTTTTLVRGAHALNKQSTTHSHYVGKSNPKPSASRESSSTLTPQFAEPPK